MASDGSVVGHARSTGRTSPGGEVVVAILAPDGSVRGTTREPYVWHPSRRFYPQVQSLHLSGDLASVRVSGAASGDEQWTFSLSTGSALGRAAAGPRPATWTWAAARIARPRNAVALEALPELPHVDLGFVPFEDPDAQQERPRSFAFHQVDGRGRVILFERTTSSVQVFDASGKRLIVARPWPSDLGESLAQRMPLWIAVREDGGLLVRFFSGVVEFAADGQRIGRTGERDYGAPQVLFRLGLRERWELDRSHGLVSLVDPAGQVARTIERGSSGRWMRSLTKAVVASDGSLALLDRPHGSFASGDVWLHVFSEQGDPVCSVELPSSCQWAQLAHDGRRIALLHEERVAFFGLDGKPHGKVSLDGRTETLGIAFSPGGELWVIEEDGILRCDVE